jgi:hypothetical protein
MSLITQCNISCCKNLKIYTWQITSPHLIYLLSLTVKREQSFNNKMYSKTSLNWMLFIQIGLPLQVNLPRILKTNVPKNDWLSGQVQYSVMTSRTPNQLWLKAERQVHTVLK